MGRNIALGFSICMVICHLISAVFGSLAITSEPDIAFGSVFLILMPILDIAPLVVFCSDSLCSQVA